jgi:hypothetical protein
MMCCLTERGIVLLWRADVHGMKLATYWLLLLPMDDKRMNRHD